ncbi:MAG: phosphatase PAP2 family protein [Thermoleophilaceae bacterium]
MLQALDLALLRLLRTHGHQPPVEAAVVAFTRTGEHGLLWQATCIAGALLDPPRRRTYLRAMRVIGIAYLVNIALKQVVRRPRPALEDMPALSVTVSTLSYPSAHSATAFAAARELSRVLPAPLLYGVATAMALSRPYVGVHYPTDCIVGAMLGTAMAEIVP